MLNHKKNLELVKDFQNLFDEEVALITDIKAHEMRLSLIIEEGLKEWLTALLDNDRVKMLDSICDLAYVCYGSYIKFGDVESGICLQFSEYLSLAAIKRAKYYRFNDIVQQAFEEVHRSNMSKACKTLDEVQATIAQPKYGNVKIDYTLKNGVYLLHFAEDWQEMGIKKGKVVKSINYSPANLEQFV